jgi:Bacteriophage Mu Gam like protein
MNEEKNFLDELIAEAEAREQKVNYATVDLMLIELKKLKSEIEFNFEESAKEREIIKNWVLRKNSKLVERCEWIERKLEAFIKEEDKKTVDLPNGILKYHKKPDRVEIVDIDAFLKSADKSMFTVIPESSKPSIELIKDYISRTGKIPDGIRRIQGQQEFSYKLKENENGEKETGVGDKPADNLRIAL